MADETTMIHVANATVEPHREVEGFQDGMWSIGSRLLQLFGHQIQSLHDAVRLVRSTQTWLNRSTKYKQHHATLLTACQPSPLRFSQPPAGKRPRQPLIIGKLGSSQNNTCAVLASCDAFCASYSFSRCNSRSCRAVCEQ